MKFCRYTSLVCCSVSLLALGAASGQLISEDFELRGSITLGDDLAGNTTQVGGGSYGLPQNAAKDFTFQSENGEGVAKYKVGQNGAASSFDITGMPSSGNITFSATVNFNEVSFVDNLSGVWIGLTAADDGLLNNTNEDHIAVRFLPVGANAGRIDLRSSSGNTFSLTGDALAIEKDRDYLLSLEFNLDTLELIGTVVDSVTSASTSASLTLSSSVSLARGQFDITGGSTTAALEDLAYFKDIAVIPEPSSFALVSGVSALMLLMCRRRQ